MSKFAEVIADTDQASAKAEILETRQALLPDWEQSPGDLVDFTDDAYSRLSANNLQQVSSMGASAFAAFGQKIANVPPILAAPAVVMSTWTAIDDAGYPIEDGTEVAIPVTGGESKGFLVVGDYAIPPGSTSTDVAEVLLQALKPGAASNELSEDPRPISARTAFVDSITLEGTTTGGVDEETEDEYLDRLTEELQLLSLSVITPGDAEIDARSRPGIARALCIPGYNADTEEEDVPLCFTVVPIDDAGQSPSAPEREELQESQGEKVPSGVLNFIDVPTYTKVDQQVVITVLPGFEPAAVVAAARARLAEYESPANCGLPTSGDTGNSAGWEITTAIYRNELIAEVDRVAGVGRVVTLLLGGGAGKAFTVAAATDKLTSAAHGFLDGDAVVLRTGLVPGAPLAVGTVYYVRDKEVNAFKLAATVGGAAINVTGDGSGTAVRLAAVESVALPGVAPLSEAGEIVVSAE